MKFAPFRVGETNFIDQIFCLLVRIKQISIPIFQLKNILHVLPKIFRNFQSQNC